MTLTPVIVPPHVAARFLAKLERKPSGCLEYTEFCDRDGYGRFNHTVAGVSQTAQRFAFALHHGHIDNGLNVLHDCDNPPCCDVTHLYQGTHIDNALDMVIRGRIGSREGESNGGNILTVSDVLAIRQLKADDPKISYVTLSGLYKVTPEMISLICRRKNWTHV